MYRAAVSVERGHLQPVYVNVSMKRTSSRANYQSEILFHQPVLFLRLTRLRVNDAVFARSFPNLLSVCFFVALANTTLAHILLKAFFLLHKAKQWRLIPISVAQFLFYNFETNRATHWFYFCLVI